VTPELTAVIVNFNAGDELRASLQSIADAMRGRAWDAVVVDNASSDGSAAIASEFAPQVRLVSNATNEGFGRAINRGVAASQGPLVLIINPDCRLEPGAIERLQAALDAHPSCAIAGPRILDPDGAVQGSARGDPDMLTGLFGRTSSLRRLLPGLSVSKRNVVAVPGAGSPEPEAPVVDWVSGACMLARRAALESVGGFDGRYFLYWEDADLCRRLRRRGHDIRYVPGATAIHQVGRSSRTAPESSIRAFHDSAYVYYRTHVAPGAMNPKRWLARLLLAARCYWRLRTSRTTEAQRTQR
jgi:N-acetylglucosaminyl-diphospho-decaprenol L-rhamnosyltransferase